VPSGTPLVCGAALLRSRCDRRPKFAVLAERNGLHDLARTFAYARGRRPETAPLHAALDSLWFNRERLPGWPALAHAVHTELESLIELQRREPDTFVESAGDLEEELIQLRSLLFGTALDQINEAAARIAADNPDLTWERAFQLALKENPELYTQYLQERADAGAGTSAESTLAVPGTRQHTARKTSKRKEQK
jgi:hypothetical protein